MRRTIFLITVFCICCSINFAQIFDAETSMPVNKLTKDWSITIDTTWGEGLTTAEKLDFFDTWWYQIDQTWGGFPNLTINWDSLKNYYRPLIEAGVSRGRFQGILTRLTRALNELHVYIRDPGIDSIYGIYYDNNGFEIEYPNFQSFDYKAGVPLFNLGPYFRTNFGAGVTAYEDSIALIFSVMPNHPLGLEPGDIILGYDGLPWRQNLIDILTQELPLLWGCLYSASSEEAMQHLYISSSGANWGLFDTIDILKHSSGDTLHYATSLLNSITQPYIVATEQLPVNGIAFPQINLNEMVSWGVVEGTSIGYVYVWDWATDQVGNLFGQAIDELIHFHKVTGLILDFRINGGGGPRQANEGFKHLFNEDPSGYFYNAVRVQGDDHFLFDLSPSFPFVNNFTPTIELYDHPIAVLTGPLCVSAGDYNAFKMRFHPLARSFGKKTSCAYTSYATSLSSVIFSKYYYKYRVDNASAYSNYDNEGYLIHKGFPVDEEVWLTRDGVANGQDDVVIRAIEWINNVVYPHDILSDKTYYSAIADTVNLSTIIENPNSHQLSARAYLKTLEGVLIDSVNFVKQTLNSSDEQWMADYLLPSVEEIYKLSVTIFDETALDQFTVPNATRFTTAGPVVLDSISIRKQFTLYNAKPYIHNDGNTATINNVTVKLTSNDPWITNLNSGPFNYPALLPGITTGSASNYSFRVIDSLFPGYYNFKVEVLSDNWPYWTDSMQVIVTGIESEEILPAEYALFQNFPNPFNPETRIQYQVSSISQVVLKVYDVIGKEVAVLVNEEQPGGRYEVEFDGSRLASGVYFYKLQAGDYVSTKKMILLR